MKEIIAIVRPKKVSATRDALLKLGYTCMTTISVRGRGKQRGIAAELGVRIAEPCGDAASIKSMNYVPKRMLTAIVPDCAVEAVKDAIIAVNQSGQVGDGKIFVCPVGDALRLRTGETGEAAIA